MLPPVGTSVGNPTDTGVASLLDPSLYEKAIEIVAADEGVDMILVISTPVPECLEHVAAAAKAIDKPLAVSVYALPESEPEIYRSLSAQGVAAYPDPKRAAYVLARMAEYAASARPPVTGGGSAAGPPARCRGLRPLDSRARGRYAVSNFVYELGYVVRPQS